nr:alpha/beta hydrolase-fold protein [Acinetobacter sp. YH12200]
MPWLDQKIVRDKQKTVLLGSSLGGLSSLSCLRKSAAH